MEKFDTKTKFLYEIGKQIGNDYRLAIIDAYQKVFNAKIDDEELTPAEIIDNLSMVMYEVEQNVEE